LPTGSDFPGRVVASVTSSESKNLASLSASFRVPDPAANQWLLPLRVTAWGIAILAGFLQVWAQRFITTPDGTCYLDIASAYLRGDWHNAVNAYWSPLFSWLLALGFAIFHPSPYWESTFLHLLNFLGLLVALVAFEFFFRAFLGHASQFACGEDEEGGLPEIVWWILGYGLFLSTTLFLLPASDTSPDIWVSAFTYIVAALILRIALAGGGWHLFALLGVTLAFAYFTKTFYFPMAFLFFAAAWLASGNLRRTAEQAALALVIFSLLAGPWVFILSRAKHRPTFGDVGQIAISMANDPIPQIFFWQGENGTGVPKHPVRQILERPRLFEFASPVGGTYPPAYDGSYWLEGLQLRLNWRGTLAVFRQSAGTFFQIWYIQVEYAVVLIALAVFVASRAAAWQLLRKQAYFWVPPLVACVNYTLVLVEFRYVAPFVLLLWLAAIAVFVYANPRIQPRFIVALFLAAFCVTGVKIAKFAVSDLFAIRSIHTNPDWEVAQGLWNLGLKPGDYVAGLSRVAESQWARVAGVRIVAEIPLGNEDVFWSATQERKEEIFRVLASTGAKMVVTKNPPPTARNESWLPLGNTNFYAHLLPVPTAISRTPPAKDGSHP